MKTELRTPNDTRPLVLVLCTGNSCRSHIAEGILRTAAGDLVNAQSAGSKPAGYVHPLAVKVMAEIGIDISGHRSKHLTEFLEQPVHTVITVCGKADQACPVFPGQVNRRHWPFDDPAHATGSEADQLAVFRRVRDEMRRVFEAYVAGVRDGVAWSRFEKSLESRRPGFAIPPSGGFGVTPPEGGTANQGFQTRS